MVLVSLWLVEVPDGCLLSVREPWVLAVLKETVKHRLVLPLIIRAAQNQGILHPDTAACQVEACIDESSTEVEPFGIRVEDVCRATLFQVLGHVLESGEQKLVEFLTLYGVVLNGKSI